MRRRCFACDVRVWVRALGGASQAVYDGDLCLARGQQKNDRAKPSAFRSARIRQIVIATGAVTTIAGSGTNTFADGTGSAASFHSPHGVAISS